MNISLQSYQMYCEDNEKVVQHLQTSNIRPQLVYLDPPYNTGRLRGARKSFRDTSNKAWREKLLSLTKGTHRLIAPSGFLAVSINQIELFNLKTLLDEVFTSDCFIGIFPIKIRHEKRQLMINATFHDVFEYLLIYRKSKATRFHTEHKAPRQDKFVYMVRTGAGPAETREIKGKKIEIYRPGQYEIIKAGHSPEAMRRYVIAGKLATANWSGEWYQNHLRPLGENLLIKVDGLEKDGLGYRWFQTGNGSRRSGVYFQSQLNAGRPILPSNDLDYTEVVPMIYKEGGPGCDFKDSKKPEALIRFLLQICTKPGDLVVDLFGGSGTTLAVAVKMQRSAIIVENDPTAIEIIMTRANNLLTGADLNRERYVFNMETTETEAFRPESAAHSRA